MTKFEILTEVEGLQEFDADFVEYDKEFVSFINEKQGDGLNKLVFLTKYDNFIRASVRKDPDQ